MAELPWYEKADHDKSSPVEYAYAVSGDYAPTYSTRAVYIGGTGNLKVILKGDTVAVTFAVTAFSLLPISVKEFVGAGTTATGILALW